MKPTRVIPMPSCGHRGGANGLDCRRFGWYGQHPVDAPRLSHYHLWWHFLGVRMWLIGYIVYGAFAAATGIISEAAANGAGWGSGRHGFVQGLLAALAGSAILRADVGSPLGQRGDQAKNLAAPLITWLGAGFDHVTQNKIEKRACDLSDDELIGAAGRLTGRVGRPGSTVTRAMIRASVRGLNGHEKDFARAELIGLIANGYLECDLML